MEPRKNILSQTPWVIGRENELAELQRAVTSVKGGKGSIVLISGEAGVGKTVLAEKTLTQNNLPVFTTRSTDDISSAYGSLVTLIRNCFQALPKETMDLGPLTSCLALLLPELGPPPDETDREILIEAITTALIAFAHNNPVAFLLDDLHWADNATLEFLPYLVDRIQKEPLLIVGTYRDEEILRKNRIRWMRNELRRRRQLTEIPLMPLSRNETTALIKEVIGDAPCAALVQAIYENTNGVPLFVEELSSALISKNCLCNGTTGVGLIPGKEIPIPQSVRDAVLLKLESLSDLAREQLEIAAIAGIEFNLELITELTDKETGLDELFDRNFIVEVRRDRGAFRHALTRTAVLSDVPWSKRRTLHRDVARYMESKDDSPDAIAEQWLKANERSKARQAFVKAAERSNRLYAYWDATKTLQRALVIWPKNEDTDERLNALEKLAYSAQLSGQLLVSEQAWSEMVESPIIQEDDQRYANIQRSLATIYSLQGKTLPALKARETSMKIFQAVGMLEAAAVEAIAAVAPLVSSLQLAEAEKKIHVAVQFTEKSERKDLHVRALGLKAFILAMTGIHKHLKSVKAV